MHQLNEDKYFHFELLRILASVRGFGADVSEVLNVCEKLIPGDFESWYQEFLALAEWVETTIDENEYDKVSLRDAYWRASRYHFACGFFFQAEKEDPRAITVYQRWVSLFDKGCRMMEIPPERATLQAKGFTVPIIIFRCSLDDRPRPTLIIGNGLDGSMEEMLHMNGLQALERGYNVVLYEGPGQPSVRRAQNIGFICNWEDVVTPIVDYLEPLPFVEKTKIALLGNSLGGWLAARAAAFEKRLAAVILIDGIYDLYNGICTLIGTEVMKFEEDGDEEKFDEEIRRLMEKSVNLRFLMNQASWAFMMNFYQVMQQCKKMTLKGIEDQINCPVFIAGAENDIFDKTDQPGQVKNALGEKAFLRRFTVQEGAEAHCHVGAVAFLNQVILSWLSKQLGSKEINGVSAG
ncbi:uncharacterized protein A1O9_05915 [Exophiala aquamarina CBS 119918]|uniref:AB hydrolase-1 domain-containing protein n=1 Tax=Exophiala aquamarina CBS 119918 TaxID=1182545 RepID=A0A072PDY8_9EURO|nr:uncharacterized protein A1O9_05915 [Exophiala aquamarina CBS 119918]KEF57992.1 hypothetical protein A1O9_05915 [Exophiala aquamarina CBS 119918]